jgi:hypothetical protein
VEGRARGRIPNLRLVLTLARSHTALHRVTTDRKRGLWFCAASMRRDSATSLVAGITSLASACNSPRNDTGSCAVSRIIDMTPAYS